ncbi:hypothetical protein [Streptomyces sp. NPDC091416]|uniref:hypothetical protein n=1 Tax=Streptomyces sp. NPDC091416 TaxID=3366003 RepID=UPI00380EB8E8
MRYRTPGGTGIEAGPCRPGAMMSGAHGSPDRDGCASAIHAAPEAGADTTRHRRPTITRDAA